MSVYIPDMEMPEGCSFCPVMSDTGCCRAVSEMHSEEETGLWDLRERPSWCPLVPVPEHGRLIDADALLKKAHYRMGIKPGGIDEIEAFIRVTDLMEAPTIIPAEEGE